MASTQGILYGVGVGPGDPDLLTLKALKIIGAAKVIAYPVNSDGKSHARATAADAIPDTVLELPVHIPMRVEREPAREAYDRACAKIADHLDAGRHVAWLCVGDPLFYGSFMYVAARLGETYAIEVVPGITSLSACAAQTHIPLGGRNDVLSVIPATLEEDALRTAISGADMAVVIKVGRHFAKIRSVLNEAGLLKRSRVLQHATGEEERILTLDEVEEDANPYFSTILVRRGELS